jgi:hypothetical protein
MDKKTVELGTIPVKMSNRTHKLHVRVDIEIRPGEKGPELSIMGDTYYPGARDIESGGQILDEVRLLLDTPGATFARPRADIARLLEIWDRWHLNGMRAGCEHQRASWDTSAPIVLVTYKQRSEVLTLANKVQRDAEKRLADGKTVTYLSDELRLVNLPYKITRGVEEKPPSDFEYAEEKREQKTAGWVTPDEHPAGLLGKPCPVCGYKYGSAWLYEPLPADVVKFLEDF